MWQSEVLTIAGPLALLHSDKPMETAELDKILQLQLIVGWAGEGETDPPRLGWWRTVMGDKYGGEDLLQRLTPKTYEWAVLKKGWGFGVTSSSI